MSYSSPEQVHAIVDAIDALIPPRDHFGYTYLVTAYSRNGQIRATYPGAEGEVPRNGAKHENWSRYRDTVGVPELVPDAWSARIHEPYELFYMRGKKEVVVPTPQKVGGKVALGTDLRVEHAGFSTHGLDIYGAGDWGQIQWTARETSQNGELAVFADDIWLGSATVKAAVEEGHFAFDPEEQQAQLTTRIRGFGSVSREEQAARTSYRLTPEGGEFLLDVLANTKVFADALELAKNPS